MKNLTLQNIALACHGVCHGCEGNLYQEITSVVTDSRKVEKGCLFVPFKGERSDAHSFIPAVMAGGALASLSERELPEADFPYIQVESTRKAVRELAAFYLDQLNIPVVGITGSVGKTSTKEAIAAVLQQKYRTLKTLGNFNNDLGVPFTIFRLREEDEIAVIEMGINHFGEMRVLAQITRPQTMVITNIGTAHLEFLKDRDGVFRAKTESFDFVRPGGHVVLNGDDDKLQAVKDVHGIRPVFFGLTAREGLDAWADSLEDLGLSGTKAVIHLGSESFEVTVPVPGRHMVLNAVAAALIGKIYGLTKEEIIKGISSIETLAGRLRVEKLDRYVVIDDCYNANPASMKSSIDTLKTAEGRRVAILGDMGELGGEEAALHEETGRYAALSGIEEAVFVGTLARHMAAGAEASKEERETDTAAAEAAGMPEAGFTAFWEPDVASLLEHLGKYVKDNDTVLVKASHFMGFERIVEALKKEGTV